MAAVDDILRFIESGADADDLLEGTFSADSPDVYETALAEHGSWDGALAAALVYVTRRQAGTMARPRVATNVEDVPRPERHVGPTSHHPLYAVTRSGMVLRLALDAIATTPTPVVTELADGPGPEHRPERLAEGIDDPSLVVVTTHGNAVRVDSRLFPAWERDAVMRPLHHRFGGLSEDDVAAAVVPTRFLRDADRFYSVSVDGQIKATDCVEYRRLDADPTVALLVKEGDALFDVFTGAARTDVLVASSAAKAIVFPTGDIRSQGRKATGVRAIQLDPGARVVGAFDTHGHAWVVLATEQGLMKRMSLDEFRPQSRGGGGLQTCRLAAGDHVAAMAPAPIGGDVVVLTSAGRVARFPTWEVPLGSRAAKGEPLLELRGGEVVTQVLGVPAGHLGA